MPESPLNAALRQFEAVEANLTRAEKLVQLLETAVPKGITFGDFPEYEQNSRDLDDLVAALPKIDGWKPEICVMDLNEIAQARLDAQEVGEFESQIAVEQQITAPARALREYRHRFNKKRRALVRDSLSELIDAVDLHLRELNPLLQADHVGNEPVEAAAFDQLKQDVAQIGMLLGSSSTKPPRWSDLHRHLAFGQLGDLRDIIEHDWPAAKGGLRKVMFAENDAIPVDVEDLGALVNAKPRGPVATRLKWETLSDDDFERMLFALISSVPGYENPEWLMRTNAPDRGRDLSVMRVYDDALGGTVRHRVIIQCKHWQTKSVGVADVALLKEQMKLWEPPRVDVCVIATSGRFTSDAVSAIERQNQADSALRVEMWPESHLERLLANRPSIIAEFGLR
jgi:hypothetical protein